MHKILRTIAVVMVAALTAGVAYAGNDDADEGMTLEENIATPAVPAKAKNAIVRHMERIGKTFAKQGIDVRYHRKGEVVEITIPCSQLFDANSTTLSHGAGKILRAFDALIKLPQLYKMIVVVHSDNTGSEQYSEQLTEERSEAIDDYMCDTHKGLTLNLIPYGLGDDEPRASNNSIAGRAANRRVEFYIVPEKQTIEMARSGKL